MHSTAALDLSLDEPENWARVVGALDPVENISTEHTPGQYARQYVDHFRGADFGNAWNVCGSRSIVSLVDGRVRVRPVQCDRWLCPGCGVSKASWLRRSIAGAVGPHGLDCFTTFTLQTDTCSAAESFTYVTASFNRFRTSLVRDQGARSYIWVREQTEKGYAHLHVLNNFGIGQTNIQLRWLQAAHTSWIVDHEPITSDRASNYITKYAASQAKERPQKWPGVASKLRVYSSSGDILFPAYRGTSERSYTVLHQAYRDVLASMRQTGALVTSKEIGAPWAEFEVSPVNNHGVRGAYVNGAWITEQQS